MRAIFQSRSPGTNSFGRTRGHLFIIFVLSLFLFGTGCDNEEDGVKNPVPPPSESPPPGPPPPPPPPPSGSPSGIQIDGSNSDSVNENTRGGTSFGILTTTDPDSGDTHTYRLVSGTGDDDNALFTLTGTNNEEVALHFLPDYETPVDDNFDGIYNIRVETDDGSNTYQEALTITINDVNEAPFISSDGGHVPPEGLATNLAFPNHQAPPFFVDQFKQSERWYGGVLGSGETGLIDESLLDSDGWVASLPAGEFARTRMLRKQNDIPNGEYVVLYDGTGTITVNESASMVSSSAGRIVIDVQGTTGFNLTIEATAPGDYVRNIRVVPKAFETTYTTTTFTPEFLDALKPFSTLRFMNTMETNNTKLSMWANRPKPTNARYHAGSGGASQPEIDVYPGEAYGWPVEVMVELANEAHLNPWFTFPHLADDTFVSNFANYVRDNLDPNLTPIIEYTNEHWNTTFDQHTYTLNQGIALGYTSPTGRVSTNGDRDIAAQFYAKRLVEMKLLWDASFGSRDFVTAAGTYRADPIVTETLLDFVHPTTGVAASNDIDTVVMGGYWGIELNQNASNITAWTLDEFFDYVQSGIIPASTGAGHKLPSQGSISSLGTQFSSQFTEANSRGLKLWVYEGGQHLNNIGVVETLFLNAQTHPRMDATYQQMFDEWMSSGGDIFTTYLNTKAWTPKFFGTRQDYYDVHAPKWDGIVAWSAANPRWWTNLLDPAAEVSIAENQTAVTDVDITDEDTGQTYTYTLSGGLDQALFNIQSGTGVLTFAAAPDYELPLDNGANNVYEVEVTVTDDGAGLLADTQALEITVTDIID